MYVNMVLALWHSVTLYHTLGRTLVMIVTCLFHVGKSQLSITEEMIRHNLRDEDLEHILSNPSQTRWTLAMAPSDQICTVF